MSKKNNKYLKFEESIIVSEGHDVDSDAYKLAHAKMHNLVQDQTAEAKYKVELLALELRMREYLASSPNKTLEVKPIHYFYRQLLKTTGVTQDHFASYINMKPSNLSAMFRQGKVNYKLAKIMQAIFKIDFSLWLDIQYKNEMLSESNILSEPEAKYSLKGLLENKD